MGKKSLTLLIGILLAAALTLAGCGGGGGSEEKQQGVPGTGGMAAEQVLTYNNGTEPETLDPAKMTGIPEGTVAYALFDGLTRMTAKGLEPAIAKSWDVSEDGLTYTFHLRDAKWSNGDPVTAHDFEFAWKRALDPDTLSEYAYQLYYIKNGQAFNEGKITDPNQVGVKALDEKTLEVTLEAPAPYFLSLTSFYTLFPLHRATVEAHPDDWANSPETLVCNGPFVLDKWEHQAKIELVKNKNYWDADSVKLDKVVLTMVEEESTYLTMWENGELDSIEQPPINDIPRLKQEGKLQIKPYLGVYYYIFNTKKEPFDDVRVRKALALAIDRQAIVEKITKRGEKPALAYVPYGIPDAEPGSDFREIGGDYFKDNDIETAKQLLADAGYPGGKGLPPITILYNTREDHKIIAEAVQEMWKKNLGIENVTLTNQEWQVYLDSRDEGNFHVARAGWIGDYFDPMTFLDMYVSTNLQNDGKWSNAEYDQLIAAAKSTGDQKARMEAMHKAEKILMDEMAIMPIYFYSHAVCEHEYVKDTYWNPLGPPDFKYAWIAKH